VNVHHGDEAGKTKNGEMGPLSGAPNVEVALEGGLLSSWRAASNVASAPATTDGASMVPAVCWGWLSTMTVVATERPPVRLGRPALGREVAPLSTSLSWREG
jgi:hypothetical protein